MKGKGQDKVYYMNADIYVYIFIKYIQMNCINIYVFQCIYTSTIYMYIIYTYSAYTVCMYR